MNDSFVNKPVEMNLSILKKDHLLLMVNHSNLKSMFEKTSNIAIFGVKFEAQYTKIATKAEKNLLSFPKSSYV